LRCSLVRGPRFPDPRADAGTHRSAVEIWPGATLAEAVRAGYACNLPLRLVRGGGLVVPIVAVEPPESAPGGPASAAPPGIVVEAVKAADDRSGDVIVRLYESLGGRAAGRLQPGFPLAGAQVVDLLERPVGEAVPDPAGRILLELRPFQVLSLRLRPRR
jgi:alpha-mannosidase